MEILTLLHVLSLVLVLRGRAALLLIHRVALLSSSSSLSSYDVVLPLPWRPQRRTQCGISWAVCVAPGGAREDEPDPPPGEVGDGEEGGQRRGGGTAPGAQGRVRLAGRGGRRGPAVPGSV